MASTISCLVRPRCRPSSAAERQRAGIAHEDHGRRRIEPQKPRPAPMKRAADDGQLAGAGDMVDLQVGTRI